MFCSLVGFLKQWSPNRTRSTNWNRKWNAVAHLKYGSNFQRFQKSIFHSGQLGSFTVWANVATLSDYIFIVNKRLYGERFRSYSKTVKGSIFGRLCETYPILKSVTRIWSHEIPIFIFIICSIGMGQVLIKSKLFILWLENIIFKFFSFITMNFDVCLL